MSPKFALSLLLLCFVLLGLSDAQRRPQATNINSNNQRSKYRNSNQGFGTNCEESPPPLPSPEDSSQNTLASNKKDRFSRKH